MATKNKFLSPLKLLLIVVILLVVYLGYRYYDLRQINNVKNNVLPKAIKQVINEPNTQFSVGTIKKTSGVYEFELIVNGKKYTSYLTLDAKLLFPGVVKLNESIKPTVSAAPTKSPSPTKKK